MISIQNLHKAYGKNRVLNGISLDFDRPGIIAVLGPNGSGKTTLIKCILGMVIPGQGLITFDGEDVRGKWAYRDRIDYLPQIARFPENLRVSELFRMVSDLRRRPSQAGPLIDMFELGPVLNTRLRELSGGTRQKVNVVQAFMHDSPVLILDEPTVGLDPVALLSLKELIRREKAKEKTILVTSHIMSFVDEMADEIVFLLEGSVRFHGSPQQLKEECGTPDLERAIAGILSGQRNTFSANGDSLKTVSVQLNPAKG